VCHVQFPAAAVQNKLGKIGGAPVQSVYRNFLKFVTSCLHQGSGYFNTRLYYVIIILACNHNLIICV
jgi:hypothetical protein